MANEGSDLFLRGAFLYFHCGGSNTVGPGSLLVGEAMAGDEAVAACARWALGIPQAALRALRRSDHVHSDGQNESYRDDEERNQRRNSHSARWAHKV